MNEALKEIIAVIRPEKGRATQEAILAAGAAGVSQHRALGRGRQSGLRYLSQGRTENGFITMGYLPKRVLSCVVAARDARAVVDAIIGVNRSGNPGDGKVFVCPLEDAVRIRTGERGIDSVSP
jgi:nitrogen regulatory protein PII 2